MGDYTMTFCKVNFKPQKMVHNVNPVNFVRFIHLFPLFPFLTKHMRKNVDKVDVIRYHINTANITKLNDYVR